MYEIYILKNGKPFISVRDGPLIIPSGKSEPIIVGWETRENAGCIRKGVSFLTDDPTSPELDLIVEGEVVK